MVGGVICAACIANVGMEAECGIAGLVSTLGMMLLLSWKKHDDTRWYSPKEGKHILGIQLNIRTLLA